MCNSAIALRDCFRGSDLPAISVSSSSSSCNLAVETICKQQLLMLARANQQAAREVKNRAQLVTVYPERKQLNMSARFSQRVFLGGLRKQTNAECVAALLRVLMRDCATPIDFTVEMPSASTLSSAGNHGSSSFGAGCGHSGGNHAACSTCDGFGHLGGKHGNVGNGGGYCYVDFGHEHDVVQLLARCTVLEDGCQTRFFISATAQCKHGERVEVIPWAVEDLKWPCAHASGACESDVHRRVFVGALHGLITAHELAQALGVFGPVERVELDHAKRDYPIGSARVTFVCRLGYQRAVEANFVRVVLADGKRKTLQIEPYLVDSCCSRCSSPRNVFFCRDCLNYYCAMCWFASAHQSLAKQHLRPLVKNSKRRL